MINDYSKLYKCFDLWNFSLDNSQVESLDKFFYMLIEKNKVMNLTSITEFDDVLLKHFIDSISISKFLKFDNNSSIVDLGTGAGFPGIPLAIAFPNCQFTLIDSLNKRINFINEVCNELHLENVSTVHSRAEDAGHNILYREKFDFCVSRAVANISVLSEYCLPLVKVGGTFISYKSGDIVEELSFSKNAIGMLGGRAKEPLYFDLPDSDISRSFVFIDKVHNTGKAYPRKAGVPSKNPLQ